MKLLQHYLYCIIHMNTSMLQRWRKSGPTTFDCRVRTRITDIENQDIAWVEYFGKVFFFDDITSPTFFPLVKKLFFGCLKARSHNILITCDCSSWRMQCCLENTIPACDSLANVAILLQDLSNLIIYIRTNSHTQQKYGVNKH